MKVTVSTVRFRIGRSQIEMQSTNPLSVTRIIQITRVWPKAKIKRMNCTHKSSNLSGDADDEYATSECWPAASMSVSSAGCVEDSRSSNCIPGEESLSRDCIFAGSAVALRFNCCFSAGLGVAS